jgi:hypothetical protein
LTISLVISVWFDFQAVLMHDIDSDLGMDVFICKSLPVGFLNPDLL